MGDVDPVGAVGDAVPHEFASRAASATRAITRKPTILLPIPPFNVLNRAPQVQYGPPIVFAATTGVLNDVFGPNMRINR